MSAAYEITVENGVGRNLAISSSEVIIEQDLTIQQDSGFTVVLSCTVVVNAGRIASRKEQSPVSTAALDYDGALFLAQSLALATGGAVHLRHTNKEGEHHIHAHPDHFPGLGPGAIDRSFLLPRRLPHTRPAEIRWGSRKPVNSVSK